MCDSIVLQFPTQPMPQSPEMEEQNAGSLDCSNPLGWALLFMGTVRALTDSAQWCPT